MMPRPHFTSPFARRQTPTTPATTTTTTTCRNDSCPTCRRSYDAGKRRATTDSCGHVRCRACTRDRKRTCQQCAVAGVNDEARGRITDLPGIYTLHSVDLS